MLLKKGAITQSWIRRRPEVWPLLVAVLTALGGYVLFHLLPEIYRGRADIRVRNDNVVSTLEDVTTQQFIDQRISTLLERAKDPEQLRQMLLSYEDDLEVLPEKESPDWEAMLSDLRGRIYLDWRRSEKEVPGFQSPILLVTAAYVVVESDYPAVPAYVANTLAEKIIQDYSLVRVQDEQRSLILIEGQISRLSDELDEITSRISEYELRNPGTDSPHRRLLRNQIDQLSEQIIALEIGRDTTVRLIAGIGERAQTDATFNSAVNRQAYSEISALALQARSELDELAKSYSHSHPEVVRLSSLIQGLEEKLGSSSGQFSAQERNKAELSSQKSELELSLVETENILRGLKGELAKANENLTNANIGNPAYNQMLLEKMAVERELVKLRRKSFRSKLAIKLQKEELVTQLFFNRKASPSSDPVYPNPLGWGVLIGYLALLVFVLLYGVIRKRDLHVTKVSDMSDVFEVSAISVVPTHKPSTS